MKDVFYLSLSFLLIVASISIGYYFLFFLPNQKDEKLELEAIKIVGESGKEEAYQQAVINCRSELSNRIKNGEVSLINPSLTTSQNADNWMKICMPSFGYKWD